MKLIAETENERLSVELRREGTSVAAEVEGRGYEFEVHEAEPGVFLLLGGGRVYECRVERVGTSSREGFAAEVHLKGRAYPLRLFNPKRLRGGQAAGAHDAGRAEVVAPMPGKLVRVLVEAGAQVEAGAGLVVVEAMKMQNELKSPKAGTVVEVRTEVGATVNAGDVLVVVE